MKKVLVTGATGFIGNYVVEELLKNNCSVIASGFSAIEVENKSWKDKVEFIPFNLEDFDANINYYNFFHEPDIMIHLAWEGLPNYKSLFHFETNLPRHYFFLKNLISNGLKDLTAIGTCFEYGMQEGCLSEDFPSIPENSYAIAKDSLRKYLQELQKNIPFSMKWSRLFYLYGKGQNPNAIISQLDMAIANGDKIFNMSKGEQERDYLSVEKVAEYIVKISLQSKIDGIINCCSGKPITIRQLVEEHLQVTGKSIELNLGYYPYTDYEPMKFWGDISKLLKIIKNGNNIIN